MLKQKKRNISLLTLGLIIIFISTFLGMSTNNPYYFIPLMMGGCIATNGLI